MDRRAKERWAKARKAEQKIESDGKGDAADVDNAAEVTQTGRRKTEKATTSGETVAGTPSDADQKKDGVAKTESKADAEGRRWRRRRQPYPTAGDIATQRGKDVATTDGDAAADTYDYNWCNDPKWRDDPDPKRSLMTRERS